MFIAGLTNHAQDQLAIKFGITGPTALQEFAKKVTGVEGVDWVSASVLPSLDPRRPSHGRKIEWEGQTIVCVCGPGRENEIVVVTVLGERGELLPVERYSQTPQEMSAQLRALEEHIIELTHRCTTLADDKSELVEKLRVTTELAKDWEVKARTNAEGATQLLGSSYLFQEVGPDRLREALVTLGQVIKILNE